MGTVFPLFLISKRTDDITKRKKAFVYVYSWWKKESNFHYSTLIKKKALSLV